MGAVAWWAIPIRRSFVGLGNMARMDPAGFEMRARKILVMGGSQGARALNQLVPEALAQAGLAHKGVEIVHQAGHAMCDAVRAKYESLGLSRHGDSVHRRHGARCTRRPP